MFKSKTPIQIDSTPALFQVNSFSFILNEDSSFKISTNSGRQFALFLHYFCIDR